MTIEKKIHEESLGSESVGSKLTLTYMIDELGRLNRYEKGDCSSFPRNTIIKNNPLYETLITSAVHTVFSAGIGMISANGDFEQGLIMGLATYVLTIPIAIVGSAITEADKRAWDKYQSHLRLKLVE